MLQRLRKAQEENESGFTLIELLVVIIIIGILAAIAIPIFLNQRKKGYNAAAKSDMRNLATAEESYKTDNPDYTNSLTNLTAAGVEFKRSNGVKVALKVSADGEQFCIESYNTKTLSTAPTIGDTPAASVFVYDSIGGGAAASTCSVAGTWTGWL
ncbi:MAG: prepilin-type N-terminal cleavage/methylation domain-containing protein [Frankia sp.]|nr:prepilin-type N-terminal cleavage/methylation domain-containing protein [Frankia sp.]